jgi:aminoglycoside phosphotransferase (APT) family kinase protein
MMHSSISDGVAEVFSAYQIDCDRLVEWLEQTGVGRGPINSAVKLSGGTQNVLIRFSRGQEEFVLRRGPVHLRPESNRTMMREARLLAALKGTAVRHPAFVAGSEDPDILGAAFYIMRAVDGFNATLDPPQAMRTSAEFRHHMGISLVTALLDLSKIDPVAVGLGDFGKLDGFIERQVGRWAAHLDGYNRYKGWTGRVDLAGIEAIGKWLNANLPSTFQPGIIHGDYHIGNVIYSMDAEVAAIVDWEMATLGDPLVDLGRILSTWPDSEGRVPMSTRVEPWDGFPRREELIEHYQRLSGRDLSELRWFEILSCYKLAIILEGSYARAQAGEAEMATAERLHRSAVALLRRAQTWLED